MIWKYLLLLSTLFYISCSNSDTTLINNYTLIEEGEKPISYKVYELNNGLKVYLSVNKKEPRIQTYIGIKTGSKNNPEIAHYLERMMYRGTSKIGTDNWEKEKDILNEISVQYELRSVEQNTDKQKAYFSKIDSLSLKASEFSMVNEYEKIISELGGQGTNSYTSLDHTVFLTNIPNSEINKWAKVEAERFSEIALRALHTEIESKNKEYNEGQDSDNDRVFSTLSKALFPDHPYGNQINVTKLNNPSMKQIEDYFNTYYIPNNMILALSGDMDYEKTIKIISDNFSELKQKNLPSEINTSKILKQPKEINLIGKENSEVIIMYKLSGLIKSDNIELKLIDRMFSNGHSGLLDLNLIQTNKVQDAYSFLWSNEEYSMLILGGSPNKNQTLSEVSSLLLNEVENLKKGSFFSWLPDACLNDIKKEELNGLKDNNYRASLLLNSGLFTKNVDKYINKFQALNTINKKDIIQYCNDNLLSEYVILKKKKGEVVNSLISIPKINPIKLRKNVHSPFYKMLKTIEPLKTEFSSKTFGKIIDNQKGEDVFYIQNTKNELFSLNLIFEFGKFDFPLYELIPEYIKLIGTDSKSLDQVNTELFKLGGHWSFHSNNKTMNLKIEGLHSNFEEIINEVVQVFSNPKVNPKIFKEFIKSKIKHRKDLEYNKSYLLWEALLGKVQYSSNNPFIDNLSINQLSNLKEIDLQKTIKNTLGSINSSMYFGPATKTDVNTIVKKLLPFSKGSKSFEKIGLKEKKPVKEVLLLDHSIVQTELILVAQKGLVNESNYVFNQFFNAYFETLANREIRESEALAYSTYISINEANTAGMNDYIYGYIGCQPDKLPRALSALELLLKTTPEDRLLFEKTKTKLLKEFNSKRFIDEDIFWEWKKLTRKGFNVDVYNKSILKLNELTFEEFQKTFNTQVKNLDFSLLVIGNKKDVDLESLGHYGTIKLISKSEILP